MISPGTTEPSKTRIRLTLLGQRRVAIRRSGTKEHPRLGCRGRGRAHSSERPPACYLFARPGPAASLPEANQRAVRMMSGLRRSDHPLRETL